MRPLIGQNRSHDLFEDDHTPLEKKRPRPCGNEYDWLISVTDAFSTNHSGSVRKRL